MACYKVELTVCKERNQVEWLQIKINKNQGKFGVKNGKKIMALKYDLKKQGNTLCNKK